MGYGQATDNQIYDTEQNIYRSPTFISRKKHCMIHDNTSNQLTKKALIVIVLHCLRVLLLVVGQFEVNFYCITCYTFVVLSCVQHCDFLFIFYTNKQSY